MEACILPPGPGYLALTWNQAATKSTASPRPSKICQLSYPANQIWTWAAAFMHQACMWVAAFMHQACVCSANFDKRAPMVGPLALLALWPALVQSVRLSARILFSPPPSSSTINRPDASSNRATRPVCPFSSGMARSPWSVTRAPGAMRGVAPAKEQLPAVVLLAAA